MLFYSDQHTPRLEYMLDLVSNEIFNEPFRQTTDKLHLSLIPEPKLNYSKDRIQKKNFILSAWTAF